MKGSRRNKGLAGPGAMAGAVEHPESAYDSMGAGETGGGAAGRMILRRASWKVVAALKSVRHWLSGHWPAVAIGVYMVVATTVALLSVCGRAVPVAVLFLLPVLILLAFAGVGAERRRHGREGG